MDKRHASDPLALFGFATFLTMVLVVAVLGTVYWNGGVPGVTRAAGTGTRLSLFLYLWGGTWWTTKQAMRSIELPQAHRQAETLLVRSFLWGGINGWFFLLGLMLVAEFPALDWSILVGFVSALPIALLFGGIPAFLIGGIIGLILATVVLFLVSINTVLCARCSPRKDHAPCLR